MTENKISVYWGCRQLNLIDRASDMFNYLKILTAKVFPEAEWEMLDSGKIDLNDAKTIKIILENLKKEIKSHYKLKSVEDTFTEEINSIGIFSNQSITIRISIGGCANIPNSINIERRFKSNIIHHYEVMKSLFEQTIFYFAPDWGVITDRVFYKDIANQSINEYWFGWMNYFSKKLSIPIIPSEFKYEVINELGKLYITTEEIFDVSNPVHVEKAKMLVDLFRKERIERI